MATKSSLVVLAPIAPYLILIVVIGLAYLWFTGVIKAPVEFIKDIGQTFQKGFSDIGDSIHNSTIARRMRGELSMKDAIQRAKDFRQKAGIAPDAPPAEQRYKAVQYFGGSRH